MLPTRELVAQIQQVVASGGAVERERLIQLATSFVMACRRVNERAEQCRGLLEKSRRREAVRTAREEPALQAEAQLLEFPERRSWVDFCERVGVELRPFDVQTDLVARVLDQLHTDTETLDGLLRVHRRLALGKAPLAMRLTILWKLYQADPDGEAWRDDVEAFEAARLDELERLARSADARDDADALEGLLGEVRAGEWLGGPPKALIHSIEERLLPYRRRGAAARRRDLAEQLRGAHSALDDARARTLLDQWRQVGETTGIVPEPALAEAVEPVATWLAELQAERGQDAAFDRACTTLHVTLDADDDAVAVEAAQAAVLRFGRGMPPHLTERLRARVERLRVAGRRRLIALWGGIAAALILAAAGAAGIIVWQAQRGERARWQTQISGALDRGDLTGAGQLMALLEQQRADLLGRPEFQRLKGQVDQRVAAERQRGERVAAALASVQSELDAFRASDTVESSHLMALLDGAAEDVATDDERRRLQALQQAYAAGKDEKLRVLQDAFRRKLQDLGRLHAELNAAQREGRTGQPTLASRCVALATELANLPGATAESRTRVEQIAGDARKSLAALREQADAERAVEQTLERLPTLFRRPDELAAALRAFHGRFPTHALAADFDRAAASAIHWQAVEAWRALRLQWGNRLRLHDPTAVEARLGELDAHLKAYPRTPYRDAAIAYRGYLRVAKAAMQGGSLLKLDEIRQMFANPLIADVLVLRAKDGRAYYTLAKKAREHRYGGRAFVSIDHIVDGALALGKITLDAAKVDTALEPAPQTHAAKAAADRIRDFRGPGWETFCLGLAELVRAQEGIDPVLRASILVRLLQLGARCAPFRGSQIDAALQPLSDVDLDVAWMNPDDRDANRIRPRVAKILARVGALDKLAAAIESDANAMARTLAAHRPVGIVLGTPPGVDLGERVGSAPLFVLQPSPGVPTFRRIGAVEDGLPVVDRKALDAPRGTLVFAPVN